jgi:hypothetical protein
MGLESTRQELSAIKETIEKLTSPTQMAESVPLQQEGEQKPSEGGETGKLEVTVVELGSKCEGEGVSGNLQENQQAEPKNEE